MIDLAVDSSGCLRRSLERFSEINLKVMWATGDRARTAQAYWSGVLEYVSDFMEPSWIALNSLGAV